MCYSDRPYRVPSVSFRAFRAGASVWTIFNRELAMGRLIVSLWLISALTAGTVQAQPFTPNEAGVTMGGMASKPDERLQRVTFPGVVAILQLGSPRGPATGGSAGTVVNHVALS